MKINEQVYQATIGVLLLVIIIGGGWWLWCKQNAPTLNGARTTADLSKSATPATSVNDSTSSGTVATPTATLSGEAVSVGDQPAGSFVSIGSVTLSQTGWVAVRDSGGRVLGAARLEPGTNTGVQVPLLRNTVSGERYQVLIYIDDGDKQFDLHKDILVTNPDGSILGAAFAALYGD